MCKFFSLVSKGDGEPIYFNWEQRKKILSKHPEYKNVESADSHTSIATFYGFKGEKEDVLNKYEYNPLTKEFTIDQINNEVDDSKLIERFCRKVDFKTIVEPLIIKNILNPLTDVKAKKVTKKDIELIKEWAFVSDSVRDSVSDSVRDSVSDSVRDRVLDSVRDRVLDSVSASVLDSVRDSVWYSVWYSVWDSVMDSVWYSVWDSVMDSMSSSISTHFDIQYKHNFGVSQKLWDRGLVPSFDGKKWRLHAGKDAKIVWEGDVKDIDNWR